MSLLILVVDDEPDVETLFRQQFRRDLRSGRFTMEFAQSAPVALQRITDAAGVSLILILSDINMPGMNGLDLLPKAKALRPDVPVIMITAYGDAETKRKALENGAEALLTKPIDFGTLRSESIRVLNAPRNLSEFAAAHESSFGASAIGVDCTVKLVERRSLDTALFQ
jgi:CheY-like chemotaxis protein